MQRNITRQCSNSELITSVRWEGWFKESMVDEAHCIEEWGKQYMLLCCLRTYIDQQVHIIAGTTTCTTKTFDVQ